MNSESLNICYLNSFTCFCWRHVFIQHMSNLTWHPFEIFHKFLFVLNFHWCPVRLPQKNNFWLMNVKNPNIHTITLTFLYSYIHSFIHSLIHSFIHSFIHFSKQWINPWNNPWLVTENDDRTREIQHIKQALKINNYPEWMLTIPHPKSTTEDTEEPQNEKKIYASTPYIKGISERLQRAFKSHEVTLIHKPVNSLRSQLVRVKDTTVNLKNCVPDPLWEV